MLLVVAVFVLHVYARVTWSCGGQAVSERRVRATQSRSSSSFTCKRRTKTLTLALLASLSAPWAHAAEARCGLPNNCLSAGLLTALGCLVSSATMHDRLARPAIEHAVQLATTHEVDVVAVEHGEMSTAVSMRVVLGRLRLVQLLTAIW